jgi:hypothetical protein
MFRAIRSDGRPIGEMTGTVFLLTDHEPIERLIIPGRDSRGEMHARSSPRGCLVIWLLGSC